MSHLTRRERDALVVFATSAAITFLTGFLWGAGLDLFTAISLITFIVYAPAGVYLSYRGVRRAGRWSLSKYRGRSA